MLAGIWTPEWGLESWSVLELECGVWKAGVLISINFAALERSNVPVYPSGQNEGRQLQIFQMNVFVDLRNIEDLVLNYIYGYHLFFQRFQKITTKPINM